MEINTDDYFFVRGHFMNEAVTLADASCVRSWGWWGGCIVLGQGLRSGVCYWQYRCNGGGGSSTKQLERRSGDGEWLDPSQLGDIYSLDTRLLSTVWHPRHDESASAVRCWYVRHANVPLELIKWRAAGWCFIALNAALYADGLEESLRADTSTYIPTKLLQLLA